MQVKIYDDTVKPLYAKEGYLYRAAPDAAAHHLHHTPHLLTYTFVWKFLYEWVSE